MTCNAKLKSFKHDCRQVELPHGLSANRPSNQLSIICKLEKVKQWIFFANQSQQWKIPSSHFEAWTWWNGRRRSDNEMVFHEKRINWLPFNSVFFFGVYSTRFIWSFPNNDKTNVKLKSGAINSLNRNVDTAFPKNHDKVKCWCMSHEVIVTKYFKTRLNTRWLPQE